MNNPCSPIQRTGVHTAHCVVLRAGFVGSTAIKFLPQLPCRSHAPLEREGTRSHHYRQRGQRPLRLGPPPPKPPRQRRQRPLRPGPPPLKPPGRQLIRVPRRVQSLQRIQKHRRPRSHRYLGPSQRRQQGQQQSTLPSRRRVRGRVLTQE